MKWRIIAFCLNCIAVTGYSQRKTINIIGIHQLVSESISENKLQVKARDRQAVATANEQANMTMLARLKGIYRTLQQRYNTLGTAIDAAQIGIYAYPMLSRIISNQAQIYRLAAKTPALAAIGYQSGIQFANKARSLINYITGLTLSIGDVNQMRASDRKLLFDYLLAELNSIRALSGNMLDIMEHSSLSGLVKAANPFQNFRDADKAIAGDIIRNARYLKQ